jgi:hypothetical protein
MAHHRDAALDQIGDDPARSGPLSTFTAWAPVSFMIRTALA